MCKLDRCSEVEYVNRIRKSPVVRESETWVLVAVWWTKRRGCSLHVRICCVHRVKERNQTIYTLRWTVTCAQRRLSCIQHTTWSTTRWRRAYRRPRMLRTRCRNDFSGFVFPHIITRTTVWYYNNVLSWATFMPFVCVSVSWCICMFAYLHVVFHFFAWNKRMFLVF